MCFWDEHSNGLWGLWNATCLPDWPLVIGSAAEQIFILALLAHHHIQ